MRQPNQANLVPESDTLYPFSIQLGANDKWFIYDLRTGGHTNFEFDTYKAAEIVATTYRQQVEDAKNA